MNQSNPHIMKANQDQFSFIAAHITKPSKKAFHRECIGIYGNKSVQEIMASNYGWLLHPFISQIKRGKSHALMLFSPLPKPYDTMRDGKLEIFLY